MVLSCIPHNASACLMLASKKLNWRPTQILGSGFIYYGYDTLKNRSLIWRKHSCIFMARQSRTRSTTS